MRYAYQAYKTDVGRIRRLRRMFAPHPAFYDACDSQNPSQHLSHA